MGIDPPCPLCGRELAAPSDLKVCGTCFSNLDGSQAIAAQATGEFAAMTPDKMAELLATADPPAPPASRPAGQPACSWCGRGGAEVKKLLSSAQAHICDGCVALCAEILDAELGEDWRT